MNDTPLVRFTDVSFFWPPEGELEPDRSEALSGTDLPAPVFDAFTADIPGGFISLTGPNGSGKTTFMLLASGRVLPRRGRVELLGNDTRVLSGAWADSSGRPGPGLTPAVEHARNLVCSFLYQNMEFDAGDDSTVGTLLEYVYVNGGHRSKDEGFFNDSIAAFELEKLRARKLDALSKGEIQRVLLAFSALYGSRVIMMDEPVFAMEMRQKERALEFFGDIRRRSGVSICVSLHELSLTRKYADTVLLFHPDRTIEMGACDEVLTPEALERAYGFPAGMLYDSERLTRDAMLEQASVEGPEKRAEK